MTLGTIEDFIGRAILGRRRQNVEMLNVKMLDAPYGGKGGGGGVVPGHSDCLSGENIFDTFEQPVLVAWVTLDSNNYYY